jgi:hypothetical protein
VPIFPVNSTLDLTMNIKTIAAIAASVIATTAWAGEKDAKCGAGSCGKKETSGKEHSCGKKDEAGKKESSCAKKDGGCSKKDGGCAKK